MKSSLSLLFVLVAFVLTVSIVCVGGLTTSDSGDSYYGLLGLTQSQGSDVSALKKSYRKLALQHHPDKATDEEDKQSKQAFFVKISQAYEILSEPRTKARYDYLLSQGQLEYDANRDWNDFDVSQGFKRMPKSAAQKAAEQKHKAAEAKYREAQEIFKKAQEEAEEFALWTALSIAFGIALLPAIYMYLSRKATAMNEEKKRKERSSTLKENQAVLVALQEEQARERKLAQEEEREYARQLKREREEAAAAAAASVSSSSSGSTEGESWEVVDTDPKVADESVSVGDSGSSAAAAAAARSSSEEDETNESSKVFIRCTLCKKSFKSQHQMENHEQSNQHKKAVKDAGKKLKSRRDE